MTKPIAQATIAANNKAYKAVFNEAETFESDDAHLTAAIEAAMQTWPVWISEAWRGERVKGSGRQRQWSWLHHHLLSMTATAVLKLSVGLKRRHHHRDRILEINDTPGLGLKAKEPAFKDQFTGKNAQSLVTSQVMQMTPDQCDQRRYHYLKRNNQHAVNGIILSAQLRERIEVG